MRRPKVFFVPESPLFHRVPIQNKHINKSIIIKIKTTIYLRFHKLCSRSRPTIPLPLTLYILYFLLLFLRVLAAALLLGNKD